MTTEVMEQAQAGVCPDAAGAIVLRDSFGQWRGRYRDGSPETRDVPLMCRNGEHARELLAKYLGILAEEVRIFEPTGRRY